MFCHCNSLLSISLRNFNTKQVTNMNYMFYKCSSLTELDLSGFDTMQVRGMEKMFYSCSALAKLDLTSFGTPQTNNTISMFENCGELTSVYNSRNWNPISNSTSMFKGCVKLKGAVPYDDQKTNDSMANPTNGYFTIKPVATSRIKSSNSHNEHPTDLQFKNYSLFTLQGSPIKENFDSLPPGMYIIRKD